MLHRVDYIALAIKNNRIESEMNVVSEICYRTYLKRIFLTTVMTLFVLLGGWSGDNRSRAQDRVLPSDQAEINLSFAPVARNVLPSVVNVQASRRVQQNRMSGLENDPFFQRFFGNRGFGNPRGRDQSSLGSGVIISRDGIVITNNHVIEGATEIKIALSDRREYDAEVMLKDELSDIAILRILDADVEFPALEFGNSDALEVGDLVLAVGNPFGVGQTVTSGIVSALARSQSGISDYQFFIQTDAAINPGNSGGALVDMSGRLIGINTAIFTRSGGSIGIGFAIPSNMARVIFESSLSGDRVQRPWLGAGLQTMSAEIAQSLGLERPRGVLITDVYNPGPATRGGLRSGDVILSVDGEEISDPQELNYRLATRGVGGTASLIILRDNLEVPVSLALETPPEIPARDETLLRGNNPFEGATVGNLSPALASELRRNPSETGVVILSIEPGSWAHQVRFKPGDIIRIVNGVDIESVEDLKQEIVQSAHRWALAVERNGRLIKVLLRG